MLDNNVVSIAVIKKMVSCNKCGNGRVKKIGRTLQGKQRYLCQNIICKKSFILDYTNNVSEPKAKQADMRSINEIVSTTNNKLGVTDEF
ncbi:IS1 family transposase [Endozoicomonas sp. SM1973]|uniref:IS1 family transposase n=1 Tax=Spartinivicinus marinus TaxID=2994442 RepID=A0A853IG82_9GAMM|nr:IS1 family transposase [Spartinivicinus marinus]MCX4026048.1 hypothetical protein [Spartinivicinus marinus]NYZ69024.1 IS1 family transposase [Spartinivicinus marinus]